MNLKPLKIMVFGRPGAGKSTFSYLAHNSLNIPVYHLDKYFFESNWIERNYQEFLKIQQKIVDSESWIIDGNAIKSLEMRYSQADLVLYFNYPKILCCVRILQRLFYKDINIDDRAPRCNEKITLGLLRYLWNFDKQVNNKILYLNEKYPNVKFMQVKNNFELDILKKLVLCIE